jgi:hypothetical protein
MIFLPHYQINDKTCCYVSSKVCLVVSDCRWFHGCGNMMVI